MNEIKVTVTYDQPTTTKFDALMAEYNAAKKVADETAAYYKPLADAAEEAKMLAILDQLETIKDYANQLSMFYKNSELKIETHLSTYERGGSYSQGIWFTVCRGKYGDFSIKWGSIDFNIETLRSRPDYFTDSGWNILGEWDKWKIYERLEKHAINLLQNKINAQNNISQKQIDRLNNIVK